MKKHLNRLGSTSRRLWTIVISFRFSLNRITLLNSVVLAVVFVLLLTGCQNNEWEQHGKYIKKGWPMSITNGKETYVFDYKNNTAVHYFNEENAEKIWFSKFKNPPKDALKRRYVIKTQKYMDNGWIYSDSIFENDWPLCLSKGNERYIFDYVRKTAIHYWDNLNAEIIQFSVFSHPQNDVLDRNNVVVAKDYMVDGWLRGYAKNEDTIFTTLTKGSESFVFDYPANTVIHCIDAQNTEELRFSKIDEPQRDAIEKRNVIESRMVMVDGWKLEGVYGKNKWPLSMKKDNFMYTFDYNNMSVTLTLNNQRQSKTWYAFFTDPPTDVLQKRNVIYTSKNGENGWSYYGSWGKYEYPTSMKSGNELYEFDYRNGFLAYHYVNGRRTEAIEIEEFSSPMDFINNRSRANIKEYNYTPRGELSYERYLSRGDGSCYFDVYFFDNGYENYDGICVKKKGTGFLDDIVVDVVKEYVLPDFLDVIFGGGGYDIFHVYEIDKRTGEKKEVATLKYKELKNYLLINYLGWTSSSTINQQPKSIASQNGQTQQKVNKPESEELVTQVAFLWSNYHNTKDNNNLLSLYASQVNYYQSNYSKEQIKASKEKMWNKYPAFKQEISELSVEDKTSYYIISFDKKVWTDLQSEPKTYPSYLHVKMIDGSWKIITESDLVTDKNLSKKNL